MALSKQPPLATLMQDPSLVLQLNESLLYLFPAGSKLTPQPSLLPQFSIASVDAPLLQTAESRLAPELSVDIHAIQQNDLEMKGATVLNQCRQSAPDNVEELATDCPSLGTCRICFEQDSLVKPEDPNNPLISPCQCTGGSKYVHRQCLRQWREKKHRSDAYYQCEICRYRYRYQRLWWSQLLGHQTTLTMMFAVTLVACIALLGFVPVTNDFLQEDSSPSSNSEGVDSRMSYAVNGSFSGGAAGLQCGRLTVHALNGIIMMAVLGLMLGLMVKIGRVFGLPALLLLPDPWSSTGACMWCMDFYGNGCEPVVECSSSAGECGLAVLMVVSVVALLYGLVLAAYMLYGVLWVLVQASLSRAQELVENVHRGGKQRSKDCSKE